MDDPILKFMEEYFYHISKKWKRRFFSKFYPTLWAPYDINMISGYNSKNERDELASPTPHMEGKLRQEMLESL